ncbi:MAG: hypothetical protein JWQ25_1409 [Daejeonella sp.]|nr:hypothetical protein [Daejeonella sp.]
MKSVSRFLSITLMCCNAISSCSQNSLSQTKSATDIFKGSTPCNPSVNAVLKIPLSDTCVFMKWELELFNKNGSDSSFKLLISYGDFQPNTMYFLGGGKSMSMVGKLRTSYIIRNSTKYKILHLAGDKNAPELVFIQLDNNILHLIDNNMKFIKGDPGFAFVLNRIDISKSN